MQFEAITQNLVLITQLIAIGLLVIVAHKLGVFRDVLISLFGKEGEFVKKIDALAELGGKVTISKGVTKTAALALQEPTVAAFIDKYFWTLKPILALLLGHFKGNDIEFMRFVINEGSQYDTSHVKPILKGDTLPDDIDALEEWLNSALSAVQERKKLQEKAVAG